MSDTESTSQSQAKRVAAALAAAAKRRGPGRPPMRAPAPALEKHGIVDSPRDPNHRLEFVYSEPTIFKCLFTYLKNLKAQHIHMRCRPDGLTFFARDHSKKNRIVAHVAGEHVNWMYCDGEFWVGLNRESVEKLFASIDKSFFKITIIQAHEDTNSLHFVFKDADIDKECNYRVTVSSYAPDEDLYEAEDILTPEKMESEFPIEFTLTEKQFKKTVSDTGHYSDTLTVEKIGDHPLQLTYARAAVIYHEVYRSAEKIRLRSQVASDETFRATINLSTIKSLASAMVTDDITIRCREVGDMLFRSAIDAKALVVSTLTELA